MRMNGLMMNQPLLISSLLRHAERHHASVEVVSARVEGDLHRETFGELAVRARRMAKALLALGAVRGDRIATMAWNGHRHMELYFAVSGSELVLHTLNPRLHADQIAYIVNHASDQVLCFDLNLLETIEAVAPKLATVRHFIAMTDRAHMPKSTSLPNLLCYEDLLAAQDDRYDWPIFDENAASSLCYTSGTTGNPKGVLYSHRSTVLHTFAAGLPDGFNISGMEVVLPIVPMFHVNAWGLPYLACMVGAKLVFPGSALDGKSLYALMENEKVTFTAGVPTVWQGLLTYLQTQNFKFSTLKRTLIGGSACPPAMMRTLQETYGVQVNHAWGMTELSPLGLSCTFKPVHEGLSGEQRYAVQAKQGRAVYGVDFKIVDDEGAELPWDGKVTGELRVRGPWVISEYFGSDGSPLVECWFPTGDVCSIDADGYVQITDRSKDVIKSGGEWISSIDVEGIAVAHPGIAMAACIAASHPRWSERPLLVAVKKPDAQVTREALLAFFEDKVPKWWIPDDVIFVDSIPLGATGKMQKNKLREQFREYRLPTADPA
jgi:acyl-CoA synthetase (AMP-forming)/AMP-acid ligase II